MYIYIIIYRYEHIYMSNARTFVQVLSAEQRAKAKASEAHLVAATFNLWLCLKKSGYPLVFFIEIEWDFMVIQWDINGIYPLVMTNIAIENHHFQWENPLFLWPFSIAM